MKLLHLFAPETAHRLALQATKWGLVPEGQSPNPHVALLGKTFINPVGLAAGADKRAEALAGWSKMGFGFVEAGSVTLHPRAGNPRPRLWRLPGGALINWLGLPGDGLAPFVRHLQAFSKHPARQNLVVGASLAAPEGGADELKQLSAAVAPHVDYLTLNMSCPNVAGHAVPDMGQVKAVVSEAGGKPVLVKLAPTRSADALSATLTAAMESGAKGLVATNTVSYDNRALLPYPPAWPEQAGKPVGGYSGPQLLDTSCWMVGQARALLGPDAPIIGCGGVQGYDDALRIFSAGADLVQLYTGLVYKGPALLDEIKQAYCLRRRADHQPLLSGGR